jgi:hypothetical protein
LKLRCSSVQVLAIAASTTSMPALTQDAAEA